jgi:hypothetical protein
MRLDDRVIAGNRVKHLANAMTDIIAYNILYEKVSQQDADKWKSQVDQVETRPVDPLDKDIMQNKNKILQYYRGQSPECAGQKADKEYECPGRHMFQSPRMDSYKEIVHCHR